MNSLIEKAAQVAVKAHGEQVRKTDGSPYIVHPFMVALKLTKHNFSDTVIAAALTHDVLEDTDFSKIDMRKELGEEVVVMVEVLSENKPLSWEERKRAYVEAVRSGSEGVKAVSISDKIHNLESLLIAHREQGPAVWKIFNRGKKQKLWFEEEMLKMFRETWQHPLVEEYEGLVKKMKELV